MLRSWSMLTGHSSSTKKTTMVVQQGAQHQSTRMHALGQYQILSGHVHHAKRSAEDAQKPVLHIVAQSQPQSQQTPAPPCGGQVSCISYSWNMLITTHRLQVVHQKPARTSSFSPASETQTAPQILSSKMKYLQYVIERAHCCHAKVQAASGMICNMQVAR